jgi:hypothetical protein|tara:strand:+ start:559 stop:840 length:282 start_codon:yes stop_codon:yes gene_type:complete
VSKEVYILKLKTGEEVVARVSEGENDTLILDTPMTLQAVPGQQPGQMGLALVPWIMASSDTSFTISSDQVMTKGKPKKDMESQYLSQATGLAL